MDGEGVRFEGKRREVERQQEGRSSDELAIRLFFPLSSSSAPRSPATTSLSAEDWGTPPCPPSGAQGASGRLLRLRSPVAAGLARHRHRRRRRRRRQTPARHSELRHAPPRPPQPQRPRRRLLEERSTSHGVRERELDALCPPWNATAVEREEKRMQEK